MTALAFNSEQIAAKELKPSLLELDGISRETVEAHYKLYQGYVNKRNEILGKLAEVDLSTANQVYSDVRALKVDLTFAIGGIKNHEIYFEHLGGHGGDPDGAIGDAVKRDFGSVDAWREDLKATGMGARGWAWTAYDWDERRLFNYIGDAQNTFPVWNATPLVALDVYEHAYFLDFQTDRASYIEAFFHNLDWNVVERLGRGLRNTGALTLAFLIAAGYLVGSIPTGYWVVRVFKHEDIRKLGSGNIGGTNVWRVYGPLVRAARDLRRHGEGLRPGADGDARARSYSPACSPAARPCSATGARSSSGSSAAARSSRRPAARPRLRADRRRDRGRRSGCSSSSRRGTSSLASMIAGLALPAVAAALGYPWPVIAFAGRPRGRDRRSSTARTSAGSLHRQEPRAALPWAKSRAAPSSGPRRLSPLQ